MTKQHNYKKTKKVEICNRVNPVRNLVLAGSANDISNGVKVLGISASPRRNGNSEILLDKVLEGASSKGAETEKVVLNKLSIRPCQGCERCQKNGICFIKDDMRSLYKKLKVADAIVVASPVYFGSITAQLKLMIDRCQCIWVKYFLLKNRRRRQGFKKGIFISVSGHYKPGFFKNSKEIVKLFFAVLGVRLFKEVYVPGLEYNGQVLKKKSVLTKAFKSGIALMGSYHKTL